MMLPALIHSAKAGAVRETAARRSIRIPEGPLTFSPRAEIPAFHRQCARPGGSIRGRGSSWDCPRQRRVDPFLIAPIGALYAHDFLMDPLRKIDLCVAMLSVTGDFGKGREKWTLEHKRLTAPC